MGLRPTFTLAILNRQSHKAKHVYKETSNKRCENYNPYTIRWTSDFWWWWSMPCRVEIMSPWISLLTKRMRMAAGVWSNFVDYIWFCRNYLWRTSNCRWDLPGYIYFFWLHKENLFCRLYHFASLPSSRFLVNLLPSPRFDPALVAPPLASLLAPSLYLLRRCSTRSYRGYRTSVEIPEMRYLHQSRDCVIPQYLLQLRETFELLRNLSY